jgi:hypothetical protein
MTHRLYRLYRPMQLTWHRFYVENRRLTKRQVGRVLSLRVVTREIDQAVWKEKKIYNCNFVSYKYYFVFLQL